MLLICWIYFFFLSLRSFGVSSSFRVHSRTSLGRCSTEWKRIMPSRAMSLICKLINYFLLFSKVQMIMGQTIVFMPYEPTSLLLFHHRTYFVCAFVVDAEPFIRYWVEENTDVSLIQKTSERGKQQKQNTRKIKKRNEKFRSNGSTLFSAKI